jgi:hypothetical protein
MVPGEKPEKLTTSWVAASADAAISSKVPAPTATDRAARRNIASALTPLKPAPIIVVVYEF